MDLEPIDLAILSLLLDKKKRLTLSQIAIDLPYTGAEIEARLPGLVERNLAIAHTAGSGATWIISLDGCRAIGGC